MDSQAKSSPGAGIWHDQFNRYFMEWIYSGFRDHSALAAASESLENMFRRAPERAAEVQVLTTVLYSLAQQYAPPSSLTPLATLGLEAGTVLTRDTTDQILRHALLLLWSAEGHLAEERQFDSFDTLRLVERILQPLPEDDPVVKYLSARRENLHGRIWELDLERSRALGHYLTALEGADSVITKSDELERFVEQWTGLIFGLFSTMIEPVRPHLAASAMRDLRSLAVSATLGRLRSLPDDTSEAQLADMVVAVQRRIEAWGLPTDFGPLELVHIVVGFRGRLGAQQTQAFIDAINAGDRRGQLSDAEADWKAPTYAMLARLYADEGDMAAAQRSRDMALRTVERCSSEVFRALARGYLLNDQRSRSGDITDQEVEPLLRALSEFSEAARRTPIQRRLKLLLEEPLETVIEWAVRAWIDTPDLSRRVRLGVLLDILRQPLWSPVPSETWFAEAGEVSLLGGLRAALDRLQRMRYALRQWPDTVVLIIQQLGERTLFVCVTGDVNDRSIQVSFAGASYREASRGLAQAAMDELVLVAESGGVLQGDGLAMPGRRAYEALPPQVRSATGAAGTLLIVPDFRADDDSVPFELMHDGTTFLGVSKVMARLASISHAVRVLEQGAPPSAHTRALVAAAPEPGRSSFPALDFVRDEADNLRDLLAQRGWDAPQVTEDRLSSTFLTERLEYVDIWHIAAHGEIAGGEESLLLPHGGRLTTDDLLPTHFPRLPFVYLNTCFLAETRYVGGGLSRGLVYTLAERGAPAVMANLSPVIDESASQVSWEFYNKVQQGTVGEALRETRARLSEMGVSPALWGTTVLFGNPDHRLPGSVSPATNRSPDPAESILQSMALRPDPSRGAAAWVLAIKAATKDATKDAGDVRLLAAGHLVLCTENLSAHPEMAEADERAFEQAIVLADELNHLTASVITRMLFVNRLISLGDSQRVSAELEDLLPLLDAQTRRDADWQLIRMFWLALWHRLRVGNNVRYWDVLMPLESEDMEAEQADAELIKILTEGSAAEEARQGGGAELRYVEDSLDDMAWNAVLIGHHSRFEDMIERANYGHEFVRKLQERGVLTRESDPYAAALLTGLLAVLWGMQSDVYLPKPLAAMCSDSLIEAIRDIDRTWSPPTGKPWFHIVRAFPEALEGAINQLLTLDVSPQELAARADQERNRLTVLAKRILNQVVKQHPDHIDGCAAYLIGTLIQKCIFTWLGSLEAIDECLRGVISDIANANEDVYFPRYLGRRLYALRHPEWDELEHWKTGLSREEYEEHRLDEKVDLSTFYDPRNSLVHGPNGHLYMSIDDGKRLARAVLESYGRPIAEHPPEAVEHAVRGEMAFMTGLREKALEHFDEAIRACPEYGEAFACRADTHRALGHEREAERDIENAVRCGIDPNVLKPSSIDETEEPLNQEKTTAPLQGPLAKTFDFGALGALFEPNEQTEEEVQDSRTQILDALENNYEPEDASDYVQRGALYSAMGLQERAIEDLDKAIQLDPQAAKAYAGRAIAYTTLGREVEAEADVEHAIALGMDGKQIRSVIEELKREAQRQDPSDAAKVYLNSAAYHQRRGRWDKALSAFEEALKLDPQSAVAFAGRAASLLVFGRPQEALNDFDEALRLNPGYAQAHAGRAAAHAYLEEPDKVEQDLARAIELGMDASLARAAIDSIKLEPEDLTSHAAARAHLQAAAAFMDQQRLHEAIAEYSEALRLDSSSLAAYAGRASAYLLNGQAAEALRDFNEVLRLNPESSEAWCFKGWALDALERYEEALETYGEALRLNPEYPDAWYYKGRALAVGLGRLQEGLESVEEALRLKPEAPEAWDLKGAVLEELGHHEDALEAYDQALHQRPGSIRTWLAKGGALVSSGRYEEALEAYEGALRLEPRSPEAWYYKGTALHDLGCYEEALEAYDEALRLNPEYPEFWCYKGETLIELERSEEALEVLEQALRLNAEYPEAWLFKGVALGELRRFQEALEALDNALRLRSDDLSALDSKLWLLIEMGCHQEALEEVKKALRLSPEDPTFWDTKSLIYSNLGRYQEALIASDTALSYEPELPTAFQHKGVALAKLGRREEAVSWLCRAWSVRERLADVGSVVAETLGELGYDLDECEK